MTLTFDELRKANLLRCDGYFHPIEDWSPTDWATAMTGECGEACNFVKKLRRLQNPNTIWKKTPENLDEKYLIAETAKELADMIIYADLLAERLGINLGESVRFKFNETSDKANSTIKL